MKEIRPGRLNISALATRHCLRRSETTISNTMNDLSNADHPIEAPTKTSSEKERDARGSDPTGDSDPQNIPDEAGIIAGESVAQVGGIAGAIPKPERTEPSTSRSAFFVGAGILISRIIGLLRQRIFAHYFGQSGAADAFAAAFRIPNFLQNVFGEGALSASFIPVYAKLLAEDDEKEASHVANAVLGLLALITSLVVVAGVVLSPYLIDLIAPGFEGERRELTIQLVRILFPGAGLLVLSAWCLGILNSHHRFFISYTAPVAWNVAIITSLVVFGGRVGQFPLATMVAWGAVVGSALQFGIQLPTVFRVIHRLRPVIDIASAHVRTVVRNFLPVFMSRGVVQISAFVDEIIASYLPQGAVAALTYSQSLYTLPVSLFGMSVSAAELPAMSRTLGNTEEVAEKLRLRLNSGLKRIAFFIVPSAMGFLTLGDVMAGALYQTGQFDRAAAVYVWGILAGSSIGLLAATLGRLYSSTFYALRDTRKPLIFAIVHVALATVLGYLCAIVLPPALGIDLKWGVVGLTVSASVAAWVELLLLRRSLNRRIGLTGLPFFFVLKLVTAAAVGAAIGWGIKLLLAGVHPIPLAAVVLGLYGSVYFGITYAFQISESSAVIGRILRTLRLKR